MKTKKKDIHGRTFTRLGYCLHIVLIVLGFISFSAILLLTKGCDANQITLEQYLIGVIPCLAVFGASVLIYAIIFD